MGQSFLLTYLGQILYLCMFYTEEDTTSHIPIKILFQELSENRGIGLLNERSNDPKMQDSFESMFPKDSLNNKHFSINFFSSIGLSGLTENLREYLKNMLCVIMQQQKQVSDSESDDEIHKIHERLVLSQSLKRQILVKVTVTEDEESGRESEAILCYC